MGAGAGYSEAELEAAVGRLVDGTRLGDAEAQVAVAAPALQRVLVQALASGGWFEGPHRSEIERVSAIEEAAERATATSGLLAEETRISMMVGVAVGWALAAELGEPSPAGGSEDE